MEPSNTPITSTGEVPASVAFLQKMMNLLNDETAPTALWWMPGNIAFGLEPDLLSTQVLDKYFQGSKFTSFLRRLHKAGFRRKTREFKQLEDGQSLSKTAIVFQHEWFQKEKPELILRFGEKPKSTPATSHFKSAVNVVRSASPQSFVPRTHSPVESPRGVINPTLMGLGHSSYLLQQFVATKPAVAGSSPVSSGASSPAVGRTSTGLPSAATQLLALRLMQQQNCEQQRLRQRQEELFRERMLMANVLYGNSAAGSTGSPMLGSNGNRQSILERLAALQQQQR